MKKTAPTAAFGCTIECAQEAISGILALNGCPQEGEVMSRTMLLGLLLGGAVLCSQQPSVIQKQKEPWAVEGRVINNGTGAPLPRVTITVAGAARLSAESGEDGRFALQGLTAGRYTLIAQHAGYLTQAYGARSGSTSDGAALDLAAGQQVKDVLIKLVPAAVISGQVLDESGEPGTDMAVAAFQSTYSRGARQWVHAAVAVSNDRGEFRITGLAAGRYLVGTVNLRTLGGIGLSSKPPGEKPEREYVVTFYPGATDVASAMLVQVAAGAEASGTVIRWQRADTVRITGKVVGAAAGNPASVRLSPKGVLDGTLAAWQGAQTSTQGTDGTFELKGITPGAYLLSAGFMVGQEFYVASAFLQVGEQHIDGLVLQPVAALELAGAVVVANSAPVKLNTVQIGLEPVEYLGPTTILDTRRIRTTIAPPAAAGEDGKFTLKTVLPNLYRVNLRNLPEGACMKSMRYGGHELAEDGIDLTGGVFGTLHVALSMACAQVDGVVRDIDDKPVSEATVVLVPDSRHYSLFKEARATEKGSFSIKGIAPGEYKILAWDDIEPDAYQDTDILKRYESKAEILSLQESDRKRASLKVLHFEKR